MGMEAADPMRTPHAFRVPLAARPLLSNSAFRAKFGLGVIWLSEVSVGVPSISANAFDNFQSTGLTGYDVPSKNRTRRGCR